MLSVCEITDNTQWDKLVSDSPQGTIFCESRWLNLFGMPKRYGVYKGRQIIGGFGGFDRYTPLTPFQGILTLPGNGNQESLHHAVADALIPYLPHEVYCHYTYPDVRPLMWAGYTAKPKYTYVVDLTDMDALWKRLDKDTRNLSNCDHQERESFEPDHFYTMYKATLSKKGISPVSNTLLEEVMVMGRMFFNDGAAVVAIQDSKRAYYILGASDKPNCSCSLLWYVFRLLHDDRVPEIDLVGCNSKDIAAFKKGFGGRLETYFALTKV